MAAGEMLTVDEAIRHLRLPRQVAAFLAATRRLPKWGKLEFVRGELTAASEGAFRADVERWSREELPRHDVDGVAATTAAELVDLVRSLDGWLTIGPPPVNVRAHWRRLIHAAQPLVMPTHKLCHVGRDSGTLHIWIEPRVARPKVGPPAPIPLVVPSARPRYHPLIAPFAREARQSDEWVATWGVDDVIHAGLSRRMVPRALMLLQSLLDEAERRGYGVVAHAPFRDAIGLAISIRGHPLELSLFEETETRPGSKHVLVRDPQPERRRTGRLVLLHGHDEYRRTSLASDGKRWRFEDRLGHALTKLEQIAVNLEREAEHERRRARAARRVAEQQAARDQAAQVEAERQAWLMDLIDRRQKATALRAFIDELGGRPDYITVDLWAWMLRQPDRIDPAMRPPALPPPRRVSVPKPSYRRRPRT